MAGTTKTRPKYGILTSNRCGSPTLGSRYPVGTGTSDALPPSPPPEQHPATPFSSPGRNEYEDSLTDHPVDIFLINRDRLGKLYDSADTRKDKHSGRMNGSRIALKSRTNRPHLVVQIPKQIAESKSTIENSAQARHLASHADHSLESSTSDRVQDADDLDLENKIRSALSRRSILNSRSTTHKTVRWADPDPAIVSCGPRAGSPICITEPSSVTQQDGSPLRNCVKSVVSLKKHDRLKLRELLDTLSRIDEDNSPLADLGPGLENPNLNPQVLQFTSSLIQARTRPEYFKDCNTWSTSYAPKPTLPRGWMRTSHPAPIVEPVPTTRKLRPYKLRPIFRPSEMIPQDGHGREAKALNPAWAGSILESFIAKYPLTGKLKAAAPARTQGRLAATIQQRLEYLLMETREKKGLEKKMADKAREFENGHYTRNLEV